MGATRSNVQMTSMPILFLSPSIGMSECNSQGHAGAAGDLLHHDVAASPIDCERLYCDGVYILSASQTQRNGGRVRGLGIRVCGLG